MGVAMFSYFIIHLFTYRASEDEIVSLGSLVSGVVEQVTHRGVIVLVNANAKGTISTDHLADHHGMPLFCFYLHEDMFLSVVS